MGSFNVACSISNLSISSGTKVAFLPLIPQKYLKYPPGMKLPGSHLIYPYCYMNPLCLPLFGEYDEYGSIKNIEHNENTAAIEKFLGISIEQFIECCTSERTVSDHYCGIFRVLVPKNIQKAHINYRHHFGDSYLRELGFKRLNIPGGAYYDFGHKDFPYLLRLIGDYNWEKTYDLTPRLKGIGFEIINSNGEVIVKKTSYNPKRDILDVYYELTGYWIHIPKDKQELCKLLANTGGMFIHRKVYDRFKEGLKNPWRSGKSIKEELETTRQLFREYNTLEDEDYRKFFHHPLQMAVKGIGKYFRDWEYFDVIYTEAIEKGALDQEIEDYLKFYEFMYSTNRFFFPAMNGEQYGNRTAEKILLETSLEIVNEVED